MSNEETRQQELRISEDGMPEPSEYKGPDDAAVQDLARRITRTSTKDSNDVESGALRRTLSRMTTNQSEFVGEPYNPFTDESLEGTSLDPNSKNFSSKNWLKNMFRFYQSDPERYPRKVMGFSYKNLAVHGYGSGADYQTTVGNLPRKLISAAASMLSRKKDNRIDILKPMDGVVYPGEVLIVLGRPGAGCTTYLKAVAAETYGFTVDPNSHINYSGLIDTDIVKHFRGDVIYSAETEVHFPHLTVGQTLDFAALLRTPSNRLPGVSREEHARHMRDVVMATYGLSHTVNTKVGSDLVRGVSGGERKRVSIAEVALCNAPLQCWDNSTRGLDSATALEFIRSLKTSGEVFNFTSLVAVYQASEEMYELCDRVTLLYDGYQIFFGKASVARQFFIDMGFEPRPRQSTPDFLTSLSSPHERVARKGMEDKVPRTAAEFEQRFKQSKYYQELLQEIDQFDQEYPEHGENYDHFIGAHTAQQAKRTPKGVPFTVSPFLQIKYLARRGFQRIQGDFSMTFTSIFGNSAMALILGSVFYNLPNDTTSFYHRSALLFFAILFNAFSSLLEIFSLYEARPVVEKHRKYALYHPSCDALGSIVTELPSKVVISLVFNLILYFMSNLRRNPGNFFVYLLFSFTAALTMSHVFRTIGAVTKSLAEAMTPATVVLIALIIYTGFVIPTTYMHGWSRWINYINPIAYGFEPLMANEFHERRFPCGQYIPSGGAYDSVSIANKVCSATGAVPGQNFVQGTDYIGLSYKYYYSHVWRDFGILIGFLVFFLFTYLLATYLNPGTRSKGEVLVFPQSVLKKLSKQRGLDKATSSDEEALKGNFKLSDESVSETSGSETGNIIESSDEVFYWRDVCYDIKIKGEDRRLLNHVDGWVKPGTLTALMGASGAGKTTLLDTLANRVTMGVVTGDMFVNAIPRDDSFQRSTGYAQQQDLHLATSTVREALIFSALLRQPASTPESEKLAYVENVLKILEMDTYADAVVGVPGEGLNVEQRKRLTIGVELAAKPKLLLFLDEPTSGLDSQTAWSICQLMKKLSNAGQAILCTIHQPSALLLQQFDRLLFLARGGRTVYFGDIGPNCSTLTGYFESHDADPCPPDANPAEWMLHVIGAAPGSVAKHDYAEVWANSAEKQAVRDEIDRMIKEFGADRSNTSSEKSTEFAMPLWYQYAQVSKRVFQQYWRSPAYIYSKLSLVIFSSLFNGFSFFKADNSMQGLQNLMFSIFMFTNIFNSSVQQYLPYFVAQRDLYEARERPSKIFSWKAFLASQVTAEIPLQIFCSVLAFFSWYYPIGFYKNAEVTDAVHSRGGLMYFYCMLFFIYISSFAQMAQAGIELADTAGNVSNLLFMMSLIFCGVLASKEALPGFWIFMYRVSPMTYLIPGMLAVGVANSEVVCSAIEYVKVKPPSGMNCGEYLDKYMSVAGGYLLDNSSTSECSFCSMKSTNAYLAANGISFHDRWRNLGIFIAFIFINYFFCFLLYWLARVPKKKNRVKQQ